ncbi:MAG: hypothetical protein CMJ60_11805 [Planctomycetaceae bacterium]|nr:hypothetical protein [Planctomycetaceae bacterium]
MWRYEDPCPDKSTTLYLVSAMKKGINYWKVGITKKDDPLKRDPKHYLEVFRDEKIEWGADAENIEINIARTFHWLMLNTRSDGYSVSEPPAREGLSYDFPVEVPMKIYDWWLNLAQTSDRAPNPDFEPDCGNAKYLLSDCRYPNGFETAFNYCWLAMKGGAGFDFNNRIYKTHTNASTDELGQAFGWMFEHIPSEFEKLQRYRDLAEQYYKLTDEYIPQLQQLLSFRPDRPILKTSDNVPMWG